MHSQNGVVADVGWASAVKCQSHATLRARDLRLAFDPTLNFILNSFCRFFSLRLLTPSLFVDSDLPSDCGRFPGVPSYGACPPWASDEGEAMTEIEITMAKSHFRNTRILEETMFESCVPVL